MTFLTNGRQLIVVPVGGKGDGTGWMAFGLPYLRTNRVSIRRTGEAR